MTTDYNQTDGLSPITRKLTGHNSLFRSDHHTHQHTLTTYFFTNIILMADKHPIPKGKMHINCRLILDHIVCKITQRNNIRRANTCDPALKLLNEEITFDIQKHEHYIWKGHLNAHWDHRHNTDVLWKTHQQSTSIHTKECHTIQQPNSNHTQTYCELFHQTLNPDQTTCTLFTPDPAEYNRNLYLKLNKTAPRITTRYGMWTMLDHFHMCGIMLVLRAVFNMFMRNASPRGAMCFRCLMFSLA